MSNSVSNQANNNGNNNLGTVFYISTIIIALFVLWGAISPDSLENIAEDALEWTIISFGWFYMLITVFFVLFVIVLAISPFGKIKLGKLDDEPEFSWLLWECCSYQLSSLFYGLVSLVVQR